MENSFGFDRGSQIAVIERTFEEARKPITEHPDKKGVVPVEILPVFPDFDLWKYSFTQVQFDGEPANWDKREEMNQAMIRGCMDEFGNQFVAYFLPTEDTMAKRKIDEKEGREYLEDCEYEYKMEREYNWDVMMSRSSKGYEEKYYFFAFRDDSMVYNELGVRVRLTKRRAKVGAHQTNSKLIVKHRPLSDQELMQYDTRLKSLQPPLEEEENEQAVEENLDTAENYDSGSREKSDKELSDREESNDKSVKEGTTSSESREHDVRPKSPQPTEEAKYMASAPFIDLNSLLLTNTTLEPATRPTEPRVPLDNCAKLANDFAFSDTNSPTKVDCSIAKNASSKPDNSASGSKKKRKRRRKRKNSNTHGEQSANVTTASNLIEYTTNRNLADPVAPSNSAPLIHYDSDDQKLFSDPGRPAYATKRVRIRPTSHSSPQAGNFHFSDSEFEHFYSQENLHNDRKYFDNKRYRVCVQRYGNEIRVFKPVCVVRESQSLLMKVLGLYCSDAGKLRGDQTMPSGFIWPLNFGKHDENVKTIRRLIKENPVDDRLPFVSIEEGAIDVQPFSLDEDDENTLDRICRNASYTDHELDDEESDENDENLSRKKRCRLEKERSGKNESNSEDTVDKHQTTKSLKSRKAQCRPAQCPRLAHCPFCHQRFSASFNAKMHFKGRFKHSGVHISCPVSSKLPPDAITSEPILCTGSNCEECAKRKAIA